MSYQAVDLFKAHSETNGMTRFIGLVLAHYCNADTLAAWPSIDLLMLDTGASERTIRKALKELETLNEFTISESGDGTRLYTLALTCPPTCDGSSNHGRHLADTRTKRRMVEAARKRAARSTTPTQAPLEDTLEPGLEELSGKICRTREPLAPGLEELSGKHFRTVRQNLPDIDPDTSLKEKEKLTPTTNGSSNNPTPNEVSSLARAADAASGGNTSSTDMNALIYEVRHGLPRQLSMTLTPTAIRKALQRPFALGITRQQLRDALARDWTGARSGAVITYLRELEPPAPEPEPTKVFCPVHTRVDITRTECWKCRKERRTSANKTKRREGETTRDWMERIANNSP
ncbi:helix-turn-helix domain-containing protein [Dermabacter hominis]